MDDEAQLQSAVQVASLPAPAPARTFWSAPLPSAMVTVPKAMVRSSPGLPAAPPSPSRGVTLRLYSMLTDTSLPISRCLRSARAWQPGVR